MEIKATGMVWIGRVISLLSTAMFFLSAYFKIAGGPELEAGFEHLGLPLSMARGLAVLELSCVIIYLVPQTAVLGAVLLTGYLGGAMCTHLRVGDPVYVHVLLGGFIWLGIYLREDRLRALLPIRR